MQVNKRDLTNEDREAILREILLQSSTKSLARLPKGLAQLLAEKYNCHASTIRRVFARAKEQGVAVGNMKVSVASKKQGRVGSKAAFTPRVVKEKILRVPLAQRTTLRSISEHTGISRGSLHSYLKMGLFRSHSNAIRPKLTEAKKYSRMKFAFDFVRASMEFDDMMHYVHLDEKWFYLTKTTRRYYLVSWGDRTT
ncbi:hypothetical protein H310_15357 [Aphanomyces invadans]|uniref:Transposase Tc1-like domain-containing protein n=1 Tax=Aphanomyces invadans TaxID=157072 RepID=A0A024T898_9STRA|nr:hypothetical protein H310_15357 [Aphanomyces invadans]ETV89806.1 hypothetical protein H310_15357 [Aphanomyces invadans]|eukprot:XP_008881562.1 hypothetical protein H310_15357 [Aphanomyces invadans]